MKTKGDKRRRSSEIYWRTAGQEELLPCFVLGFGAQNPQCSVGLQAHKFIKKKPPG
jgi:hypothetical protein